MRVVDQACMLMYGMEKNLSKNTNDSFEGKFRKNLYLKAENFQ